MTLRRLLDGVLRMCAANVSGPVQTDCDNGRHPGLEIRSVG
jgi:hypothetical protein